MKEFNFRRVFLLIWFVTSISFAALAETEPNNTAQSANTINPNGEMVGNLASNDVDWYQVNIPEDGKLSFEFTGTGDLKCDNLKIYDVLGNQIVLGTYGVSATVSYPNLEKGSYFVRVPYWSGTAASYTLKCVFQQALLPNDQEPNDSIDQAIPISLNDSSTGRLFYRRANGSYDTNDWYKVTTTNSGKLLINFHGEETLRSNNLKLYDSDKTTLLANGSWGTEANVSKNNLLPGTYYVNIPQYEGYGSYTVSVVFSEANLQDDIEPNNLQTNAQIINLSDTVYARLGFENAGITDTEDWYKVTIPENGALSVSFVADSTLKINNPKIYTENDTIRFNSPTWGSIFNFKVEDLAKGEYWIKATKWEGYGAYKMFAEFTPSKFSTDLEPNNTYLGALQINSGQTVTGQLGYWRKNGDIDADDWYKITVDDNSAIEFNFLTDSILEINNPRIYTLVDTVLIERNYSYLWKYNFQFKIDDIAASTYYLKVNRWDEYGAYKLNFKCYPQTIKNDTSANDSIKEAPLIQLGDTLSGNLGYYTSSNADRDFDDYYKIRIAEDGFVTFKVDVVKPLVHELYLYGPDSTTLVAANTAGYDTTRTMIAHNLKANTDYFFRVKRWDGFGGYMLYTNVSAYKLGFDIAKYNNVVKIMNHSNGDAFEWDFGDGNTATGNYPEHTYNQLGDFEITQRVSYTNNPDIKIFKKIISIPGIDRFTPSVAGNGGDLAMTIYGGGLNKDTKVKLIKGSQIIEADTILTGKLGQIQAHFDLHFAEKGTYDVSIEIQGMSAVVFNNGLTVEGIQYPYISSSIEGYGTLRTGRTWPYNLVLTNNGNVVAKGVTAYLVIPNDVELSSKLKNFSSTIDTTGSFNYYDEELGKNLSVSNTKVKAMMDLLRSDYIEIDSLFGEPFAGKVYQIFVPKINAGTSLKVPFYVKSTSSSVSSQTAMQSFVLPINIYGSCESPMSTEVVNKSVDILLAHIENIPIVDKNPYLKTFVKVTNMGKTALRNAASYFGYLAGGMSEQEAWHEAYIADGQLDKANAEVIAGLQDWAMELGLDKLNGLTNAKLLQYKNNRDFMVKKSLNAYDKGSLRQFSLWKGMALDQGERLRRLQQLRDLFNAGNNINSFIEAVQSNGSDAVEMLNLLAKECPEIKELLPDIMKHLLDNSGEENRKKKKLTVGTSVDPNEIEGPLGYSTNQFINNSHVMDYVIRFENKATAPLSAQIVNVFDTLDLTKYDLSTFELGDVTIGDSTVYFPKGRTEYFTKLDMRPTLNLKVDISAKLDTLTGVVHWQFLTLDTLTNELTNDPELGFLLPNTTPPSGEGSVAFRVKLKNNLNDAVAVSNRAKIVFDFNAPIYTNKWENTIDKQAPTGAINSFTVVNDTTFTVHWTGSDTGSKIRYYELFRSDNNGEFVNIGRYSGNSATLRGELQHTYSFCAVPVDSVGNAQPKEITAEKQITLTPNALKPSTQKNIRIYPNPSNGVLNIQMQNIEPKSYVHVALIGVDGKQYETTNFTGLQLINGIQISTKNLGQGMYLLKITYDKNVTVSKIQVE